MFTLSPKNSGLRDKISELRKDRPYLDCNRIDIRAEDIPYWITEYDKLGISAIGITGQDLFNNYQLEYPDEEFRVIETIAWNDPVAIFNRPALCVLAPVGFDLMNNSNLRVGVATKYAIIAKQYLSKYEYLGINIELKKFRGTIEQTIPAGLTDIVIDIVYYGATSQQYGLEILDVIMTSDLVVIGGSYHD